MKKFSKFTSIFVSMILSIIMFSQTAYAFCGPIPKGATPTSTYYLTDDTLVYHTSFQFRTSGNRLMSCVINAYADCNVQIEVFGNVVAGQDTYGKIAYKTNDFLRLNDAYLSWSVRHTEYIYDDFTAYTFKNTTSANEDVPLIAVCLVNKSSVRYKSKTITVFGRTITVDFPSIFTEIADMNNDGIVNNVDALTVLQIYSNNSLYGGATCYDGKGDMNKDGRITLSDALDVMDLYQQTQLY